MTGPVYHTLPMSEEIIEFTVTGSPRVVSRAIEQYATGNGSLHAIVVPWESDDLTLSMAVTSAKAEGWDIGHAVARLAPADLVRMGGRVGDVVKISGGTIAVARVEISDDAHEGMVQ